MGVWVSGCMRARAGRLVGMHLACMRACVHTYGAHARTRARAHARTRAVVVVVVVGGLKSSSLLDERAYPKTTKASGRKFDWYSSNNAGYVFFFAKSPDAPNTRTVRCSFDQSSPASAALLVLRLIDEAIGGFQR